MRRTAAKDTYVRAVGYTSRKSMSACSSALSAAREPVTMPQLARPERSTRFAICRARGHMAALWRENRIRRGIRCSLPRKHQ
ncbi:MAG: CSS-motif domain-containing protein [Myxococcales bacterium]|nr:CSS-motif domain-containing protein [Myxococcales bacterium]